jgi:DNA-binding response OmpR family regulator
MKQPQQLREAPMRILPVEDNPQTALLPIWILACVGHIATCTVYGLEGAKLARQAPFDAPLPDFNLPDPDGSQMCPVLRKELKTTPILAITAHNDRVTRRTARAFGFETFLARPIDIVELRNTLDALAHPNADRSSPECHCRAARLVIQTLLWSAMPETERQVA